MVKDFGVHSSCSVFLNIYDVTKHSGQCLYRGGFNQTFMTVFWMEASQLISSFVCTCRKIVLRVKNDQGYCFTSLDAYA